MIHGDEPVLVQTLVAELAVEALDVGVLDRLARPDERWNEAVAA
jgi:precorrin-6B methylase 1